jgi:hypothetical protein
MKHYPLTVHKDQPELHFEYCIAARLARVSEKLISTCERETLIRSRVMIHGKKGLCVEDVVKLKLIRHYHEDLGLDLDAVEFILQFRSRIGHLQRHLEEVQERLRQQEENHRIEILRLRRQVVQVADAE